MRPTIRILDDARLELVLDESLRILEEVGVKISGESMRARLADAGRTADEDHGSVPVACPAQGASTRCSCSRLFKTARTG